MQENSVNLESVSGSRSGVAAVAMFILLLVSYGVNAMDRMLFPLLAANVRKEFQFGLPQIGLLATVFTLGMAVTGMPTGSLLQKLSRKAVVQLGIAIFSLATLLTVVATGFWSMFVYRAITGIGEAMQLTALLAIAATYFVRHRSLAVGGITIFFGLGAIAGPLLGGALLAKYDSWRLPMIVFAVTGFVLMVAIAIGVRKWFTEQEEVLPQSERPFASDKLWNRNSNLLIVMSIINGLILYGYIGMYPTFLRTILKFSPVETGGVMSFYGLGAFVAIVGGWLGDRLSPRVLLSVAFVATAVIGFLFFNGPPSFEFQALLSFLWGSTASAIIFVNLGAYHVRAVRSSLSGKASGLFVTSVYFAGAIAGYIIGWLANHGGWAFAGEIQISLLSLVGAICALYLKPKNMPAF